MNRCLLVTIAVGWLCMTAPGFAASNYEAHVVFDNSRAAHSYYYSRTYQVAPSTLDADGGHLPLAFDHVHSPPNSLRLHWLSATGGDWKVSVAARKIAARENHASNAFSGDALILWLYSPEVLTAAGSPRIQLMDSEGNTTPVGLLLGSLPQIPAAQWTRIVLPLASFRQIMRDTSDTPFNLARLQQIQIGQNLDDDLPHTLYLDDIRVGSAAEPEGPAPAPPSALAATGFERHVELQWKASASPEVESYRIYRAAAGDPFVEVGLQRGEFPRYEDFIGPGTSARYQVRAVDTAGRESAASNEATARTRPMSDDDLLTMVQQGNFNFYWDGAQPRAGMALELMPGDENQVAVGASGFGIMALIVGIDRGFISREAGTERMQRILAFLRSADRYHGAWSHFLDGRTGRTLAVFGKYDDGGDLVETAFLMQGLLAARQYFDRDTEVERAIRSGITALWEGVEWDWYRDREDGGNYLLWHWSPDYGFYIHHPLIGWNETLIVYLLAIASPTHSVPATLWHSGWASQSDLAVAYRRGWSRTRDGDHFTNGHSYYGIPLGVGEGNGAELFFTQFSFDGFDARGIHDAYTDYFENNRAIARISHAYAMDNPRHCEGYGADTWGRSAGTHAGGARPLPADDNCTVVVHAALGSMPYTPDESMAALRHYYRDLGPRLWGAYGFSDSFNVTEDWYDETYRGLNQAQTVVMIENYRSGLLWRLFMRNPEIAPALRRIGFTADH